MANNRIYLKCKACGETLYLGKHFVTPFFWDAYGSGKHLEDVLNEFYDKHFLCNYPNSYPIERFVIEYESDPGICTNADRIRNMTDEELVELFTNQSDCEYGQCIVHDKGISCEAGCKTAWLEWLQAEVDE